MSNELLNKSPCLYAELWFEHLSKIQQIDVVVGH